MRGVGPFVPISGRTTISNDREDIPFTEKAVFLPPQPNAERKVFRNMCRDLITSFKARASAVKISQISGLVLLVWRAMKKRSLKETIYGIVPCQHRARRLGWYPL